jgi:uncharacterized protein with PhoU and TrkA domain
VEGQALSLAHLKVAPGSALPQLSVGQVEAKYEVSVVLLRRDGYSDIHPAAGRSLQAGDVLAILGGPAGISALLIDNQSR